MAQRLLLGWLGFATLFEAVFAFAGFFLPEFTRQQFKISTTDETKFLGFVIAWLLLFVSCICVYAWIQIWRGKKSGYQVSYILAVWWIGIGIGIYFFSHGTRPDNLFIDTLKGAILLGLTYWDSRGK